MNSLKSYISILILKFIEIESTPILYLDFSEKKKDEKINENSLTEVNVNNELQKKNKSEEDQIKKLQEEVNIFI